MSAAVDKYKVDSSKRRSEGWKRKMEAKEDFIIIEKRERLLF